MQTEKLLVKCWRASGLFACSAWTSRSPTALSPRMGVPHRNIGKQLEAIAALAKFASVAAARQGRVGHPPAATCGSSTPTR
jgi:hypothetical protein